MRLSRSKGNKKSGQTSTTPSDVTVDDVMKDLSGLFAQLGITSQYLFSQAAEIDLSNPTPRATSSELSAIGELLKVWHQDPHYLDLDGNPIPLKMRSKTRSFCDLAKRSVPSVDPIRLLEEFERIGAVQIDSRKFIHAKMRSLPVYEDRRLAIQHTLTCLDSFIRTLRHNLASNPSNSEQLFHRIAWNGNFACKEVPALKVRVRKHGQSFLESFDNWLSRRVSTKSSRGPNRAAQVSVGVYISVQENQTED